MALRTLDQEVVEELLFNNLLQQIKINSIIPYIVSLGGTNGNDVSFQMEILVNEKIDRFCYFSVW